MSDNITVGPHSESIERSVPFQKLNEMDSVERRNFSFEFAEGHIVPKCRVNRNTRYFYHSVSGN